MSNRLLPAISLFAVLLSMHLLAPNASAVVSLVSVDISSTEPDPTPATTIPITFAFGEPVTGFDQMDIVPTNGTLSNFAGSGDTYTVDISPTAEGSVGVSIAEGAATGSMTMDDSEGDTFSIEHAFVDLQIGSTAPDPTPLTTIPVTFTFDESVTGFDSSDVVLLNASLSNFSGSGAAYSADLTPSSEGLVSVTVNLGAAVNGQSHSSEAASFSIVHDLAPTFTVTLAANGGVLQGTVLFNESVTGFDASDVTVTNGVVANFSGAGTLFTFDIINITGPVTVDIADMAALDSVGNPSTAGIGNFTPTPVPDLRIGSSANPSQQAGNDVYGRTVQSFGRTKKNLKVHVSLENDSISQETFVLRSNRNRKVQSTYTLDRQNVTGAVLSGSLQVTQAPGQINQLIAKSKNRVRSSRNTRHKGVLNAASLTDTTAVDSVTAKAIFLPPPSASIPLLRDPDRLKP